MMVGQIQQVAYDEEGNLVSSVDKDVAVGSAFADFDASHVAKTLLTVGANDKIHITNIQIYNKEGSETVYKFLDGATHRQPQYPVAAGKVFIIPEDELKGYVYETSIICDPDGWGVGSEVSVGYWVEHAVVE